MIDPRRLYNYFHSNFIIKKTSQNWYCFDNPFDPDGEDKMKMAIKFSWGRVKCWRTGWTGSAIDFVMEYESLSYFDAKSKLLGYKQATIDLETIESVYIKQEVSDVNMPLGYTPIAYGKGVLCDRAKKYLFGRGFTLEVLDRIGIGYCNKVDEDEDENYFGYIIIPFKRKGKLQYYIGRDFIGNFLRYKNPKKEKMGVGKAEIIFNEDALDIYRRNFVLEGWSDALTLGKEAVATLGWSVSKTQKAKLMASECEELVFVPDVGKYLEAVKLSMDFTRRKKIVKVLDLTQIPNLKEGEDDVNSIGKTRVMDLYKVTPNMTTATAIDILIKRK